MRIKEDWTPWNEERSIFLARDTEGFARDLEALEQHIKNLTAICPKDKAGWPVTDALIHINGLTRDSIKFREYLHLASPRH